MTEPEAQQWTQMAEDEIVADLFECSSHVGITWTRQRGRWAKIIASHAPAAPSQTRQPGAPFFDCDWLSRARQIKEARGELARAHLLKKCCEDYATFQHFTSGKEVMPNGHNQTTSDGAGDASDQNTQPETRQPVEGPTIDLAPIADLWAEYHNDKAENAPIDALSFAHYICMRLAANTTTLAPRGSDGSTSSEQVQGIGSEATTAVKSVEYYETGRVKLPGVQDPKDKAQIVGGEHSPAPQIRQSAGFVSDTLYDGPSCTKCGAVMVYKCLSCGSSPEFASGRESAESEQ